MADNFSLCLIGAMDSLWFHQTVLFPEPSLFSLKTLKPQQPYSESTATTSPSSSRCASSLAEDNKIITRSLCSLPDHEPLTPEGDTKNEEEDEELNKRVRRGSVSSRNRSHSSSPSKQNRHRNHIHRHSTSCSVLGDKLQKSKSCRSLKDLELEEVKGFMDLGFRFKKEHIDSRMINVVPGLLRLNLDADKPSNKDDDDDIEQEEETGVIRPYLSEAWLIKRPDSPLLNLKVPKASAAADMKKHLKCWAQTVAYVVQQEC